jgi:uncharacterized membrane protein YdbT with pleckstrin-like domain
MADTYLNHLLGEREKIILVARQHWFQLFRNLLLEILMIVLIIVVDLIAYGLWQQQPAVLLGLLLLIIPLAGILRDSLVWNSHKYVITNRRVIQIFGVFNKNVTDSSLDKVNDVQMDQSLLGRIFNFGDIEILTASELGINRFTFINDPVHFKTAMLDAKFELEQNLPAYAPVSPVMDVPRLIDELDALRKRGAITEEEFNTKKAKLLQQI